MPELPPVEALRRLLRAQVDALRGIPLARLDTEVAAARAALDDDALATLLTHRERLAPHLTGQAGELRRLAVDAATRFGRQLRERNQYARWDETAQAGLEGLFAAYYRRLGEVLATAGGVEDLREGLLPVDAGHTARLGRFVQSRARDVEAGAMPDTVANEYSVGLQLEVLGLEPSALRPPILDVGCGPSALLVHHLRNLGLEAFGLERSPTEATYVQVSDWLETDFGLERWGSIVAHLSFTNHFVLHHQDSEKVAAAYAQAYLRLLRSLQKGGCFFYAPGVPFIEGLLPADEYGVSRREILSGPDDSPIEAVRVERLR